MKTKILLVLFLAAGFSIVFFSCAKMEDQPGPAPVTLHLPELPYDYSSTINGGFDTFTGVNNDIGTLGRVLFYDTRLSINNSISCGTCHKQARAFSDDSKFSSGFQNHLTQRNTLPIQNLGSSGFFFPSFGTSLFWDGRATLLQSMVLMPILNHIEMGMRNVDGIVAKVNETDFYDDLFLKAYGTTDADITKISDALSSFVRAIFSGNTRFDRFNNGLTQLSGLEEEGRLLFFNKYNCNSCHQTQQLNGYETGGGFVNIGLESDYEDKGLQNVSNNQNDNGKFKIPNLRNVALTGPYMHDGGLATLNQVLDHYSSGIKNHPALDPRLRNEFGQPMTMNISTHEKTAIIAFMNTLTDFNMITDPKFSNPFKVN